MNWQLACRPLFFHWCSLVVLCIFTLSIQVHTRYIMASEFIQKNVDASVERIKGSFYDLIKVEDDKDEFVQTFQVPLKVEIKIRDVLEIMF